MNVNSGKMADSIEMLFLAEDQVVGPRNHVLDGARSPMGRGNFLQKMGQHNVVCTENVAQLLQVSEQFLNSTSAHNKLFSAMKLL